MRCKDKCYCAPCVLCCQGSGFLGCWQSSTVWTSHPADFHAAPWDLLLRLYKKVLKYEPTKNKVSDRPLSLIYRHNTTVSFNSLTHWIAISYILYTKDFLWTSKVIHIFKFPTFTRLKKEVFHHMMLENEMYQIPGYIQCHARQVLNICWLFNIHPKTVDMSFQ